MISRFNKKVLATILSTLMLGTMLVGCAKPATTPAATTAPTDAPVQEETTIEAQKADLVVIGAGGAGMTAAVQAVQDGAKSVILLEQQAMVGGNTTRATGGLNAAETQFQKTSEITDTVQTMIDDTMKGGKDVNDLALVTTLATNSSAAVDWLTALGADLSEVGLAGGATNKRIHRPAGGAAVGPEIVKTLLNAVNANGIDLRLESTAKEIVIGENGAVTGVVVESKNGEKYTIETKAIVLATGGFGANSEMVVKYNSALEGFSTTNHPGALGEGIIMAEKAGAALVDIDQIQTHPTVEPTTSMMITEGVRGEGAILVNKEGKRFVNELLTRDVVSAAILSQSDKVAYLIFDQNLADTYGATKEYFAMNLVKSGATIQELATTAQIDATALEATIKEYNGFFASKKDTAFEREDMKSAIEKANFHAIEITPAVHHTMGGVKINPETQVLNTTGAIIPGFFAAGEVTGGVHGANRLGGNAVADITVFGRIAGTSAAKYISENGGFSDSNAPKGELVNELVVPSEPGSFVDGVYNGEAQGHSSLIKVAVTIENGNISKIQIVEQSETAPIFEGVEKNLIPAIITAQGTAVDTVSGGTNSSKGVLAAVDNALASGAIK